MVHVSELEFEMIPLTRALKKSERSERFNHGAEQPRNSIRIGLFLRKAGNR